MPPRDVLARILRRATQAPSGGNSQPWQFAVVGEELRIFCDPKKDHPVLNFRNRGTIVAHSALLLNLQLAALEEGYSISLSTDPSFLESRISFSATQPVSSPVSQAIERRTTNRKKYDAAPLSSALRTGLLEAGKEEGVSVTLIENRGDIEHLGKALAVNEVVMLENKTLHKLFFDEVVWTAEEERAKKGGLFLKTLELKTPQEAMIKLCRHWGVMNILNKIGMARMIAKDNGKIYGTGSAYAVFLVPDTDAAFFAAGKAMERVWLTATSLGLSAHLITGVLFFHQKIASGDRAMFSENHVQAIEDAYAAVTKTVSAGEKQVALCLRIGQGGEPSARSTKKEPTILYQ